MTPSSRRPYLVRAMHEWITDNGQTPHLVVDASVAGVEVPAASVQDGRIILNVSWQATEGLKLGNEAIEFAARFAGRSQAVRIPEQAVLGIYARETGQGMLFQGQDGAGDPPPRAPDAAPQAGGGKPRLRVVK